jgi:hypothetical protein
VRFANAIEKNALNTFLVPNGCLAFSANKRVWHWLLRSPAQLAQIGN